MQAFFSATPVLIDGKVEIVSRSLCTLIIVLIKIIFVSVITLLCLHTDYSNVSWAAPTDGACHDESCLCYNRITLLEFSISVSITLIGTLIGSVLLLVNCLLRKNKLV